MPKRYTLILESDEAASIRALIKDAFVKETDFIEKAKKDLEWWPGAKCFIDYSEKTRAILNKVYMALRNGEEVGDEQTE